MPRKKTPPADSQTVLSESTPPAPPVEPTELELVEAEMRTISPGLKALKMSNREKYEVVYRRYMWLVGRREELK